MHNLNNFTILAIDTATKPLQAINITQRKNKAGELLEKKAATKTYLKGVLAITENILSSIAKFPSRHPGDIKPNCAP